MEEEEFKGGATLSDDVDPKEEDLLGDDVVGLGDDDEEVPELGELDEEESF